MLKKNLIFFYGPSSTFSVSIWLTDHSGLLIGSKRCTSFSYLKHYIDMYPLNDLCFGVLECLTYSCYEELVVSNWLHKMQMLLLLTSIMWFNNWSLGPFDLLQLKFAIRGVLIIGSCQH